MNDLFLSDFITRFNRVILLAEFNLQMQQNSD